MGTARTRSRAILGLAAGAGLALSAAAQTPASDPASLEAVMPVELRDPGLDPFAGPRTLQAHRLRGLTTEVVGLILSHPPGGEIAFEALAMPLRGTGGKADLAIFVEIDGSSFLESNQSGTARVEIYAYALSAAGGRVAGFLAEVFAVDVQEQGEAIWQTGLKYFGHLELPAGEYVLKFLVRNYQSGAKGRRDLPLEVPAFETQQPFALSPLFPPPAARDAWLPVRASNAAGYPFVVEDGALNPAVRPVLVSGRAAQAHLFAYGVPAGSPQGRVELLRDGSVVAGAPVEVGPRRRPRPGLEEFALRFAPPKVDSGVYFLRVQLAGVHSVPAPVVVLQSETRDRGLLWTDLRGHLGGVEQPPPAPAAADATAPAERKEKKIGRAERKRIEAAKHEEEQRLQRLAGSYRQALISMGRDQRSAARTALLDLESGVLADGSQKDLQSAQLLVAEQLAGSDIESLIPVLALHDDMYQTYRRRNLHSLGFNARAMIETLAELYAERGGTQGSRVVAARALASLGGHLQEANLPASSRRLYQRALDHDPTNRVALLGLATSFERYGEYPRAVETLEPLVAAHPLFAEGVLRLAINLDRLGLRGRCRELLARAVELEGPDWVRSLAYQALARVALETGDLEAAAELLEAGLEEMPDQRGSIYLLAHIYDRRREARRALALFEAITPEAAGADSARKLYDSWPEGALDAMRRELSEAASVRLELLTRILGGQP